MHNPVDTWDDYRSFNQAIADVFFSRDMAGLPVYLDFDEDTLALIGQQLNMPTDKVWDSLTESVLGMLSLQAQRGDVFSIPLSRTRQWIRSWQSTPRGDRKNLPAPPVLALLAVFSMAAELMGSDSTMAAGNYFGRLCQLLRVDDEQQKERLTKYYRRRVELFWNVLGLWLTGLDGMRGLPSAVALSHRYIGLSMSQALVREHDRRKLPASLLCTVWTLAQRSHRARSSRISRIGWHASLRLSARISSASGADSLPLVSGSRAW